MATEEKSLIINFAGEHGEKITYHFKNTKDGILPANIFKKKSSLKARLAKGQVRTPVAQLRRASNAH